MTQLFTDAKGNIDFHAWQAHDARHAQSFADRTADFRIDDAVGRAFLTPQLHRIETQVYMRKYPSFDFASFMTVNTDGDMWDVGTLFYSMDGVGQAEFLSGKAFDVPYASTTMDQYTHAYHLAGIGYEWTIQEMERAAKLGRSLSADKAMAADKSANAFLYSVAMTGRTPGAAAAEKGWTGFVNNASVTASNVPADGTGSATAFSSKTPDQVLRDINSALNAVETGTLETHVANTLVLPTSIYNYIANTRLTDTGTSILAFLQANNSAGEALRILRSRALETAGAGGTKRMVAYDNSDEVIRFHLPGPFTFLPPFQKSSMTYEVAGTMNVGGTEIRLPKALIYRDGL